MRTVPHAAFLIDGRLTMLEMCLRFLSATRSISITAWGLTPELLLVRGKHNRGGPMVRLSRKTCLPGCVAGDSRKKTCSSGNAVMR